MFKKIIFQLHWLLGITAGLVLAVMGVTGALYSYQPELLKALNPQLTITAQGRSAVPLAELIAQLEEAQGKAVEGLAQDFADSAPLKVFLAPEAGQRRGAQLWVDPYTGQVLEGLRGEVFFDWVFKLHRWLALGDLGKQITAFSTLALVFFCVSGLYLRWPRQARSLRAWLKLDWAKQGRAFHWSLHSVVGTWALAFYLCAALTGLFWSYDGYREGLHQLLVGDAPGEQRGPRGPQMMPKLTAHAPAIDFAALLKQVKAQAGEPLRSWNVRLPQSAQQPLQVNYLGQSAAHPRAFNQLTLEQGSLTPLNHSPYAQKPFGTQLWESIYVLHSGEYFGALGRFLMMLASALMPLFFITGLWLYLDRRTKRRAIERSKNQSLTAHSGESWLVAFASQSGFAEQLAWQSAGQLQAAGHQVAVQPLGQLTAQHIGQARKALFVLSTFGDGQAPDNARAFERGLLSKKLSLAHLDYALLSLGDRSYPAFCGFARRVHQWLQEGGARHWFAPVEVDQGATSALAQWRKQLAALLGVNSQGTDQPAFAQWALTERVLLNPHSLGAPLYQLTFKGPAQAQWQAGDLFEVLPLNDAKQSVRSYSIASIPAQGCVQLLVRQQRRADGSPGLASFWLCEQLALGHSIEARLRSHSSFHQVAGRPMILLGAGSGLAGLLGLLYESAQHGEGDHWLILGERNRAHDALYQEQLECWLGEGHLTRLDWAFSRDEPRRYVQDVLQAQGDELKRRIAQGAVIYLCGSLQGMGEAVDRVLRAQLGDQAVEQLIEQGRLRRDLY